MFTPIIPGVIIWLRRRAHPIAPVATPQIDLATVDDADRLTTLAVENTDWSTLLSDPSIVVVCARTNPGNRWRGRGQDRRRRHDACSHHLRRSAVAAAVPRQRINRSADEILRERGAKSVQATVTSRDDRGLGFFASQGWRQRVRVYSRSLLLPEEKPKGWRNVVREWIKRLKSKSID